MLKQIINSIFGNRQAEPETAPRPKQTVAAQIKTAISRTEDPVVSFNTLVETVTPKNEQDSRDRFKTLLDHGLVVTPEMKKRIYNTAPALAPLVPEVQDALTLRDAFKNADAATLQGLLARGVDFDGGRAYGAEPAIITAAQKGDVAVLDTLLAHGASLETKIRGDSSTLPLHQAVMHGRREAFLRLLDAGANPNHIWSNEDGLWTINGMAGKCKTDTGMAQFVHTVLKAREAKDAPEVSVTHAIKARRPLTLKSAS